MGGFDPFLDGAQSLVDGFVSPVTIQVIVWLIALTFAWSGVAKLRRPILAASAISDFGLTRIPRWTLGLVLGGYEVTLALWLASDEAASGAYAILTVTAFAFTWLIARSLRAKESFACFCFGGADRELNSYSLLRSLALGSAGIGLLLWYSGGTGWRAEDQAVLIPCIALMVLVSIALLGEVRGLVNKNNEVIQVFHARARET